MKLVSVIITTRNRCLLLKEAIESVIAQTYRNIEIIVVDDHSTDGTRDLCSSYPVRYIYIPEEDSKGGNYARNMGISVSKGEYLAFLDDDDVWYPEKIEKQLSKIKEGNCSVVHCGRIMHYKEKNGREHEEVLIPSQLDQGDLSRRILYRLKVTTSTLFVRKEIMLKVGCFDETLKYWQEYELLIRLAQEGDFAFVPEPLCWYRVDRTDGNRLTNKYFDWRKSVEYIKEKHRQLFLSLNWKERLHEKLLFYLDASIRCKNAGLLTRGLWYYIRRELLYYFLIVVDKDNL